LSNKQPSAEMRQFPSYSYSLPTRRPEMSASIRDFESWALSVKHAAASNYPMYVISAIVYSVITHFESDIFFTPPWQKLLMCWNKWLSGNPTWCTHQTGGVSFMARVCPGNKGVKIFWYGCGTSCSALSGNPRFLITFVCQIIFLHYQFRYFFHRYFCCFCAAHRAIHKKNLTWQNWIWSCQKKCVTMAQKWTRLEWDSILLHAITFWWS